MLTASDDLALNRIAFAAGAHAWVPKPFRPEVLMALIETGLTRPPMEQPPHGS